MRVATLLFGAAAAMLAAAPAEAFRYRTCENQPLRMPGNEIVIRSSSNSFPVGIWLNGLQNAINQFNDHPSKLFYTRVNDDGFVSLNNGQNEVWGSTDPNILQGAPAIAYSSWDCFRTPTGLVARMKEGDVIFDYGGTRWTPLTQKRLLFNYTGSARLLQATAIHEFGHAAGLLHENRRYNVMGSDYTHVHTNGAVTNAYMGEDTGTANVFLYGLWAGAPQDLGVSHFRYSGAQGEYSAHARTRLFNSVTGATLPTTLVNGETGFVVRRGQAVLAEFTYENNGRTTVTAAPVSYHVSLDDFISAADLRIATTSLTLVRDVASTLNKSLRIPTNLVVNRNYWLGVVVNPTGTVAEKNRTNNATYIPIRVVP
jgi:hypothetical protein